MVSFNCIYLSIQHTWSCPSTVQKLMTSCDQVDKNIQHSWSLLLCPSTVRNLMTSWDQVDKYIQYTQGWEFALSLNRSSLICSKLLRLKTESLLSLLIKERVWAIRSGRSGPKINVSELISLLMTKEWHKWFTRDSSKSLLKTTIPSKNSYFL